ncbi:MAG: hypothetical protein JNM63_20195, partial [Spirochaetia bacterium]|nr:hypothetical protein [Spirochaetia bacterium]
FLRNADVVKVACLAQIANVIAPILVEDRGVLVQSIYHPIARIRQGAKGKSLVPLLISPAIPAGKLGECAALDVSAIHDPDQETLNIYVVNRSGTKQNLELKLRDLSATSWKAEALASENLDSRNTWDQPETVKWAPMILGAEASEGIFKIPPHAFVALSAKVSAI